MKDYGETNKSVPFTYLEYISCVYGNKNNR